MATFNNALVVTKTAAAAISANTFVRLTAADTVDVATTPASHIIYGVAMQDAASGAPVPVCVSGEAKLVASAAIGAGVRVTSAAGGKGAAAATTNECGAIAIQAATALNDVIPVLVTPGAYQK